MHRKSSHRRNSISILPGAPAEDHTGVLDASPSLIPDLPSIRTSVRFKIHPEANSFSDLCSFPSPFHSKETTISQLSRKLYQAFFSHLLLLSSHTGCTPRTLGTSHFRRMALGIPTSFRTLFKCHLLNEAPLAEQSLCPKRTKSDNAFEMHRSGHGT